MTNNANATNAATNATNATNEAKGAKGARGANQTGKGESIQTVVFERQGKENIVQFTETINPDNFAGEIGRLCMKFLHPFSFKVGIVTITVPALTKSNDQFQRAASAFKSVAHSIFAGKERETIVTGKNETMILKSFSQKGIKFSSHCKASVLEALKIWESNKRLKIAAIREKTRAQNHDMIAENAVLSPVVKQLRAENLAAITGLKVVKTVQVLKFLES